MTLNKEIPQEKLDKLKLVVFDSDGVSVPRGTEIEEKVTRDKMVSKITTNYVSDELSDLINKLKAKFTICISSGRSLLYLQTMYGRIMGSGTVLQAENGNLSLIDGFVVQHEHYDEKYFETLSKIQEGVRKLDIKGIEPKQFILSVHADSELKEVYEIVKRHDLGSELQVMWNGEAFDIQKKKVTKGTGLSAVMDHLNISQEEVIAIGDRVNDKELLETAGIAVSADKDVLPAQYWTTGDALSGETLARYLVKKFNL